MYSGKYFVYQAQVYNIILCIYNTTLSVVGFRDYAHKGPAFFTWHRLLNLNLEWQIQWMLFEMGRSDSQDFRLPYWDWRPEIQLSPMGLSADDLFTEERIGATMHVNGAPHVVGEIYKDNWSSICWLKLVQICDPRERDGPVQRCPSTTENLDPCSSTSPYWPTHQDVLNTLSFDNYDSPNYEFNLATESSFRSFADANISGDVESCRANRMCECVPGGPLCTPVEGVTSVLAIPWETHGRVSKVT
jgi:hypothetical protein